MSPPSSTAPSADVHPTPTDTSTKSGTVLICPKVTQYLRWGANTDLNHQLLFEKQGDGATYNDEEVSRLGVALFGERTSHAAESDRPNFKTHFLATQSPLDAIRGDLSFQVKIVRPNGADWESAIKDDKYGGPPASFEPLVMVSWIHPSSRTADHFFEASL